MILYSYSKGSCEIENTEKDEGKINMIFTIVFSIAGLIVLGIIVYCCSTISKITATKSKSIST